MLALLCVTCVEVFLPGLMAIVAYRDARLSAEVRASRRWGTRLQRAKRGEHQAEGCCPVSWATHRGSPQSSRGDKARNGGGHQFKMKNGGHRGGKATDAQTSRPQCSQFSSPWRAYEGDPWRRAGSGPAGGMGEGPIVDGTAGAMAQRPAREG